MHAELQAHKTADERKDTPEPLDTGIINITVDDHDGPDGVGGHQHGRIPARGDPVKPEQEDAHIVDKAFKQPQDEYREGEP